MRALILFSLLFLAHTGLISQDKLSIDIGGGYTDADGFSSRNMDGEISYYYKRFSAGIVLHNMTSIQEVNPSGEYVLYTITAIPTVAPEGANFLEYWHRSQDYFGLQLGYDIVQSSRFATKLSFGYGVLVYDELRFVENYINPRGFFFTKLHRNHTNYNRWQFGLFLSYKVYKDFFIGTRFRYINGISDEASFNLQLGIRI